MNLAGTTIFLVALMLPGILFFAGLYSPEKYSRDIGPNNTLTELALALIVAGVIHLLIFVAILQIAPVSLDWALHPLLIWNSLDATLGWQLLSPRLPCYLGYFLLVGVLGWLSGWLMGGLITKGHLRSLAKHRWIYDLIRARDGENIYVTCYVLTDIIDEKERALVYRGELEHFYFSQDGEIAHLILKRAARYRVDLSWSQLGDRSIQRSLGLDQITSRRNPNDPRSPWTYLMIEGRNIKNVLFEKTDLVSSTKQEEKDLEAAYNEANR